MGAFPHLDFPLKNFQIQLNFALCSHFCSCLLLVKFVFFFEISVCYLIFSLFFRSHFNGLCVFFCCWCKVDWNILIVISFNRSALNTCEKRKFISFIYYFRSIGFCVFKEKKRLKIDKYLQMRQNPPILNPIYIQKSPEICTHYKLCERINFQWRSEKTAPFTIVHNLPIRSRLV